MPEEREFALGKPADEGDFILQRRLRLLQKYAGDLSGYNLVLDFGCGNGAQTRLIAPLTKKLIGVEVCEAHCEQAIEALKPFGQAQALLYNGHRLPIDDQSVDLAYSFEVLEHTENDHASICDIARVMKSGGKFVFSVPNKWWIFETHGARLPILPWNRVPFFSWLPQSIHRRYALARNYAKGDIVKIFQDSGFSLQSLTYVTAPMDVVKYPPLKRLLRQTMFKSDETTVPFMATAILGVCVKEK